MEHDIWSALVPTGLMAILYLGVVRFVDMNEKEPLWAMLSFFALGALVAAGLLLAVDPLVLQLTVFRSAVIYEVARFLTIGAGVGALIAYGQMRGWDEFNGTMDGLVYGATVGLGFATVEQFMALWALPAATLPGMEVGLLSGFVPALLTGLSHGVFGAIIGAGFGAASELRSSVLRALLPMTGLLLAVLAHVGYIQFGQGNALSGTEGYIRAHVARVLPLLAVAAVAGFALVQEKRAIRKHLPAESQTGAVPEHDLALLQSMLKREALYWKTLLTGKVGRWLQLKKLHNRQVQLAFILDRVSRETDAGRRAKLGEEVTNLRKDIFATLSSLGGAAVTSGKGAA